MATQRDVRRIAMTLAGTVESATDFAFSIPVKGKLKGYAWVWKERVVPKKPRVPNHSVLAVRVANLVEKDMRISHEPAKYFTEPHYDGYPAVLVRLSEMKVGELRELLGEAWACLNPPASVKKAPTKKRAG